MENSRFHKENANIFENPWKFHQIARNRQPSTTNAELKAQVRVPSTLSALKIHARINLFFKNFMRSQKRSDANFF